MNHFLISKAQKLTGDYCVSVFNRLTLMKENMLTCSIKCRKKNENLDSKISKTKNGRLIMQSNSAVGGIKKSTFVKP